MSAPQCLLQASAGVLGAVALNWGLEEQREAGVESRMGEREGGKGYQQAASNSGCSGRWLTAEGLRSDAGWRRFDKLLHLKLNEFQGRAGSNKKA